MTHTLYREGNRKNLSNDFVLFAVPSRNHIPGTSKNLKIFFEILLKHHPINYGSMDIGNKYGVTKGEILSKIGDDSAIHAVFDNEKDFQSALKEVEEADLGLSIIASGLMDRVNQLAKEVGIKRHTVEYSLGIWGKVENLPEKKILEITTMCGHGMITEKLVKKLIEEVENHKCTAKEAAQKLSANCHCGIFNTIRAEKLMEEMALDKKC
ncbi:MAG: hypothetical protein PHW73_14540 [Atribacterota bacterium]|nr:hypothetical protein [Atribacterota bacterium]